MKMKYKFLRIFLILSIVLTSFNAYASYTGMPASDIIDYIYEFDVGEFVKDDELTVPNIKFDVLKKYNELIGKTFNSNDGVTREISDALQTIRFEIDNEGGKIKSEAIIAVKTEGIVAPEEKRYFNYNDTFYLMLREKGKNKPYFIVKVDNMNLFQENAEKMD